MPRPLSCTVRRTNHPGGGGLDPLDRLDPFDCTRRKANLSPAGHRVAGVGDKLRQALAQVIRVDPDLPRVIPRQEEDSHGGTRKILKRRQKAGKKSVDLYGLGIKDLAPAESEQFPGKIRRAFPRLKHFFDVRAQ